MKNRILFFLLFTLVVFSAISFYTPIKKPLKNLYAQANPPHAIGEKVDSFNGVYVYYNGDIGHVLARNVAKDGYNIGLKYQCVEFVKRYYYQHLKHKMPNSYGHAKDFFNGRLADGEFNKDRGLQQFSNPSITKPQVNDLLVFDGHIGNPYGHVVIISQVQENEIEIIQQNPGAGAPSREWLQITTKDGKYHLESGLGWLGKRKSP